MGVAPILCQCTGFEFWYSEPIWSLGGWVVGTPWCRCGHADDEHLDDRGSCTGEVTVKRKEI